MSLIHDELWESEPGDLDGASDTYLQEYIEQALGWEAEDEGDEGNGPSWRIWFSKGNLDCGGQGDTFREVLEEALTSAKLRGII